MPQRLNQWQSARRLSPAFSGGSGYSRHLLNLLDLVRISAAADPALIWPPFLFIIWLAGSVIPVGGAMVSGRLLYRRCWLTDLLRAKFVRFPALLAVIWGAHWASPTS